MKLQNHNLLQKQLFKQHENLIAAIIPEFDGIAERDVRAAAKKGLQEAIAAKMQDITPAYCAQAIRNEIRKFIQETQPVVEVSLEEPLHANSLQTIGSTFVSPMPNPEDLYIIKESLDKVESIVNRFPEPAKSILEQRWFWPYFGYDEQPSFADIGRELQPKMTAKQVQKKFLGLMEFIEKIKAGYLNTKV